MLFLNDLEVKNYSLTLYEIHTILYENIVSQTGSLEIKFFNLDLGIARLSVQIGNLLAYKAWI